MADHHVEFWFDFSSPYAYFAAHEIEAVAVRHGRTVLWRPFMLGVAFKATGMTSLSRTPLRGDYARRDWARLARQTGLPFRLPDNHPITALPASRAYYWIAANAPDRAAPFARAAFRAYFAEGRDMTDPPTVSEVAASLGLDPSAVERGIVDPTIKDKVRAATDAALERGVFGSPFFIVEGEPFWGHDRLPMLEAWLACGGW